MDDKEYVAGRLDELDRMIEDVEREHRRKILALTNESKALTARLIKLLVADERKRVER